MSKHKQSETNYVQSGRLYNQVDYIYVKHCTPASERNLDFNTLLWPFYSSPLTARAVTDAMIVYLNTSSVIYVT